MAVKGEIWKVSEKRKLARLLNIYPLNAYENIAHHFPKKSTEEVKEYIKKMIYSTQTHIRLQKKEVRNITDEEENVKAPLEVWLEVVSSLVENEQYDFSTCLSKVMGFISNFEEFQEGKIEGHPQPDYRHIYKYLSQVLEGDRREDIEDLGPLESAIVVDLIHSLMEVLSDCDLVTQYNVMKWKYLLMNERDNKGHPIPELLRQASENDFTEFCKWREDFLKECSTKDFSNTVVMEEGHEQPVKVVAHYTYEASYSADNVRKKSDPRKHINPSVFHNKPGPKSFIDKDTTTVTEIVRVMPPKNAIIVKPLPRQKRRTVRIDGKYFGINHNECIDYTSKKTDTEEEMTPGPSAITNNVEQENYATWQARKKKYEEMNVKKDSKKEVKKPKLYSLNPFCLPISLLDIDS